MEGSFHIFQRLDGFYIVKGISGKILIIGIFFHIY